MLKRGGLNFSVALEFMKIGISMKMSNWNDEYIYIKDGIVRLHRKDGEYPNWSPSSVHMLSNEWETVA